MRWLWFALLLVACGDDPSASQPDARMADAAIPIDAPPPPKCNYTEASDTTNGASATAEVTSVTSGTICGQVNSGHFDAQNELVDQDIYRLTFITDTDVIVRFTGDNAAALDDLAVQFAQANNRAGFGSFTNDHGAFVAHLTAGTWYLTVGAFDTTALGTSFSYSVKIATDTARCAHLTTGGFTEAGDGALNNGNDVIRYDQAADPVRSLTPGADTPEASNITVASGMAYRMSGSLANVNVADSYMDRDTFAFKTGPTTNEISVRLNWPSTAADLDLLVVKEATLGRLVGAGLDNSNREEEFETFAVAPNTNYWLWVGAYDGATLPASYDVTLCGDSVTP